MGNVEARIRAVTTNASLVIGLTFLDRPWNVISQDDVRPGLEADVAVLDLGSTKEALAALAAAKPLPRFALIIGEREPPAGLPPTIDVLVRPYTVTELAARIDQLLKRGKRLKAEPVAEPSASLRHTPETGAAESVASTRMLFGRLVDHEEPDEGDTGDSGFGQLDDAPPAAQQASSVTKPDPDVDVVRVPDLQPNHSGGPLQQVIPAAAPPATGQAQRSREELRDEAFGNTLDPIRQVDVPAEEPSSPSRWFTRKARNLSSEERGLRERLAEVLVATNELEDLLEQVPLLGSLPALGKVLVADAAKLLSADSVGLWRSNGSGWVLVAHHGFTPNEATWIVPPDQPLFAEVDARGGAMLIDPIDRVQAAVAGIGGAHTKSFMAASVAVGSRRCGIIGVGRAVPLTTDDLEALVDLASEMAPGMAVAEQLARLRGRLPDPRDGQEPDTNPADGRPGSWFATRRGD